MKKTHMRQQNRKAGMVEAMGTGRGRGTHADWGRQRSVWSGSGGAGPTGALASELNLAAARQTVCACRKSETLEAFQALEEGRVDRLDGKTPVPPSKGHLVRRQSSPSLPREVRLGCAAGLHPNSPSWVSFPHTFCSVSATCFSSIPLPSIPNPPAVDWDLAPKRLEPFHPLGVRGFSSVQAGCRGDAVALWATV